MFRLLQKLFRTTRTSRGRRGPGTGPGIHRVRPTVETLEDRLVLSARPLPDLPGFAGGAFFATSALKQHLFIPKVTQVVVSSVASRLVKNEVLASKLLAVADLSNVHFALLDSNNPPHAHQLVIHNQFFDKNGAATFDGLWDQGNNVGQPVFGQLAWDGGQGIRITFTFGSDHSFAGHITVQNNLWHLEGDVTVTGGGGPGHVSGNEVEV
jgi:hypothetical protein